MAFIRQTAAQTLDDAISWRPVLEPVLRAFEPVLTAQAQLSVELKDKVRAACLPLPPSRAESFSQGLSLLAGAKLNGIADSLCASAEKLLPLLRGMEALEPHLPTLLDFFTKKNEDGPALEQNGEDARQTLAEALVAADAKKLERAAQNLDMDPAILAFTATLVISPVLRAMTAALLDGEEQAPWDKDGHWQQGYCPVCGALPTVGWLDKPDIDEKNAFLAGGGGKKHLHCGMCGADWKFRRGACPACGAEGGGVMEILRETSVAHGERLDWCAKCKAYCPTVDLREREFVPDPDAMALGMMHLDMVAARKKLRPLKASFWNIS